MRTRQSKHADGTVSDDGADEYNAMLDGLAAHATSESGVIHLGNAEESMALMSEGLSRALGKDKRKRTLQVEDDDEDDQSQSLWHRATEAASSSSIPVAPTQARVQFAKSAADDPAAVKLEPITQFKQEDFPDVAELRTYQESIDVTRHIYRLDSRDALEDQPWYKFIVNYATASGDNLGQLVKQVGAREQLIRARRQSAPPHAQGGDSVFGYPTLSKSANPFAPSGDRLDTFMRPRDEELVVSVDARIRGAQEMALTELKRTYPKFRKVTIDTLIEGEDVVRAQFALLAAMAAKRGHFNGGRGATRATDYTRYSVQYQEALRSFEEMEVRDTELGLEVVFDSSRRERIREQVRKAVPWCATNRFR